MAHFVHDHMNIEESAWLFENYVFKHHCKRVFSFFSSGTEVFQSAMLSLAYEFSGSSPLGYSGISESMFILLLWPSSHEDHHQ